MGHRREAREHQKRTSKPNAAELDHRNRQSALGQSIRLYTERPDPLPDRGAWIELDPVPKIVAVKDGVVYELEIPEAV